jgi:predicted aspartyl protease
MVCPKCGFSQPDDYYCANCGVNIEKYVQKKRKKWGYALVLAIGLLGIVAIGVARYVQTLHRTEEAETISASGYDETDSASKQKAPTESEIQRAQRAQRSARRSPTTEVGRTFSRSATEASSERGVTGKSPGKSEEQVKARQTETAATASQWFEIGRALDDDSELEMTAYRNAIELDPKFAPAYYYLGGIYYRRGDNDQAEVAFVRFLQYSSEEERLEYDIYRYYSDHDLNAILEKMAEEYRTSEGATKESGPESVGEEGEESGPESVGEEVEEAGLESLEEVAESAGPEGGSDVPEKEVQTIVRFTSHNGQILVPVVLNGSVTGNVLVDTGSGVTIISSELASDIGVKVARGRTIKLRTIGAEVQVPLARLDSIELGNLRRNNFPVAVSDLRFGKQRRFDGILGMDFLNNYAILIDHSNNRILLTPRTGE